LKGREIGEERVGTLSEDDPLGGQALQELGLLDAVEADHDEKKFLAGETTPVFFGSALWNFGVRLLLDAIGDTAPEPQSKAQRDGSPRPIDSDLSGFVFKMQANLDPRHRDHIAYMRVCSGEFSRGMNLVNYRTGKTFATKYAHQVFGNDRQTVDTAYPGDVVGLVNASDLRIGDSLSVGGDAQYPPIPTFAPEHFRIARNLDTARYKQFRKGVAQLDQEGVIQALHTYEGGEREPILAAVGQLQFDVALHRLQEEFGAQPQFDPAPYSVARRTDTEGSEKLSRRRGVQIASRTDGTLLALFTSQAWLDSAMRDHPDLTLDPIIEL